MSSNSKASRGDDSRDGQQWRERLLATIPPQMDDLIMQVSASTESPEPWLETGLAPLDYLLDGGIRAGEVFVLAGRPSVGKSALALQIILHVAMSYSVALWSFEMRPTQWVRRGIAALSGIQPRRLRRGEMQDRDYPLFVSASGELSERAIHFAVGDSTPTGFAEEAARQAQENGAALLVIDYLGLMRPEPGAYNRENEVAIASRTIKEVALRENVAVLLLAQLNRNAEGKPPNLSDLRESGSIEQDADEVFFLHREKNADSHVLGSSGIGILAKNRDGEVGSMNLRFDGSRYRFYPVESRPAVLATRPTVSTGRRDYGND